MLDLKPSVPMDWSATGLTQCATEHPAFSNSFISFLRCFSPVAIRFLRVQSYAAKPVLFSLQMLLTRSVILINRTLLSNEGMRTPLYSRKIKFGR